MQLKNTNRGILQITKQNGPPIPVIFVRGII